MFKLIRILWWSAWAGIFILGTIAGVLTFGPFGLLGIFAILWTFKRAGQVVQRTP